MKYFEALGLAPKLALDSEDLQQRFYERTRQWHPDRFGRASEAERRHAEEMTALLNDAFRTLRDPVSRAEYLLAEYGLEPSQDAPAELLEEVFELNMALEELRNGEASARGPLLEARDRFAAMLRRIDEELAELFARHDFAPSPEIRLQIRGVLNRRRYIANLVRDVDKELHVHSAN
jgi:molecular chaperone HscB